MSNKLPFLKKHTLKTQNDIIIVEENFLETTCTLNETEINL